MKHSQRQHQTYMQITTRDINHGTIADVMGHYVEVIRQPAGRRALFIFDRTPEVEAMIEAYERREILPLPTKAIITSRNALFAEASRVCREGV